MIFPIKIMCDDGYSGAPEFRKHFLRDKPGDLRWYGYDTIIHSRNEVEFVVREMRDNVYGGIGEKIATFRSKVPRSVTKPSIEAAILREARKRREAELAMAEEIIIASYADEIRASLSEEAAHD